MLGITLSIFLYSFILPSTFSTILRSKYCYLDLTIKNIALERLSDLDQAHSLKIVYLRLFFFSSESKSRISFCSPYIVILHALHYLFFYCQLKYPHLWYSSCHIISFSFTFIKILNIPVDLLIGMLIPSLLNSLDYLQYSLVLLSPPLLNLPCHCKMLSW